MQDAIHSNPNYTVLFATQYYRYKYISKIIVSNFKLQCKAIHSPYDKKFIRFIIK